MKKELILKEIYRQNKRWKDAALLRLYDGEYPQMSEISPKPGSLSVIIRSFKSIPKMWERDRNNDKDNLGV